MSSKSDDGALALLGCVGIIALVPMLSIFDGWVLTIMWRWFVVPQFHVAVLSVPCAIGLSYIVSLMKNTAPKTDDDSEWYTPILTHVGVGLFVLLIGYIAQSFM